MSFRSPRLHANSRLLLLFASLVGAFPVTNINSRYIQIIKYKAFSIKTVYSHLLLMSCVFIEYHALVFTVNNFKIQTLKEKGFKAVTAASVFYGSTIFSQLHFIALAKKWPDVLKKWADVEQRFSSYQNRRMNCRYFQFTILSLSILEHLIHNFVHTRTSMLLDGQKNNWFSRYLEVFTRTTHGYVIPSNEEYHFTVGLVIVVCSFTSTVIWTLNGVFITTVSMELTQFVRAYKQKLNEKKYSWEYKRLNYRVLADFVEETNTNLKEIIGFAVFNDIFFICVQLIQAIGTHNETDQLKAAYYSFSFSFLVFRASCSLIATAQIHTDSMELTELVYASPSNSPEVERFALELRSGPLALTYFNFGKITRATIMSVLGTIISYEIILIQMQGNDPSIA